MKLFVAKNSGFCKGVKSAVETAMNIDPVNTFLLGELIHNELINDAVRARGIVTVESVSDVPDGATLIIRSHGAGRKVFGECERRNIRVVDCTCPFVKRTQDIIDGLNGTGKTLVVAGESPHPEVVGLLGWFEGETVVINDPDDQPNFRAFRKKFGDREPNRPSRKKNLIKLLKILQKFAKKQLKFLKQFVILLKSVRGRRKDSRLYAMRCS